MNIKKLSADQFALLFDVRRSIRYHDRRRAFFDTLHRTTAVFTVILASSIFLDLLGNSTTPRWLTLVALLAAGLAALDVVIGFSRSANMHHDLKRRFVALEMQMVVGDNGEETFNNHMAERLAIEQDEPPIFRALDLLCNNEVAQAEGLSREDDPEFAEVTFVQRATSQLYRWSNLRAEVQSKSTS